MPVIGPFGFVPNPTLITLTYSSSIFTRSLGFTEEIPERAICSVFSLKFKDVLCAISV